jgi:hypothetical protein
MTNPKPTQKLKCAICGRETFYPGKWRWMDPDAEKKSIVHTECWKNVSNFVLPLEDQVEILLQENANLKYQVAQLPPVYTKCADAKPTDQGQYLVHCRDGNYNVATYLLWCSQWLDQYQEELQVIEWMPVPK